MGVFRTTSKLLLSLASLFKVFSTYKSLKKDTYDYLLFFYQNSASLGAWNWTHLVIWIL